MNFKAFILIILLNLTSCGPESAYEIGYALGYSLAYEATYEGELDGVYYYSVPNCIQNYYILSDRQYYRVDCRYYSDFSKYVIATSFKNAIVNLYFKN